MNGAAIRTFFHSLIDNDELDVDFEYSLMNAAKEEVESLKDWEILKKLDTSLTASATSKALPSDFFLPLYLFVGSDVTPYSQIPFEQKNIFINNNRCWYIDLANSAYYLLGTQTANAGKTLNFNYLYATSDIAAATSPVWPERFHKLLGYQMAKNFYAADQTERNFSWAAEHEQSYKLLKNFMVGWYEGL